MVDPTQPDHVTVLARSARILADPEADYSSAVRSVSAALRDLADDPLVARVIFHLAIREGTPLRTRFIAQVLERCGHEWMASLLVARALQVGAKSWEKRNLRALVERKPRQAEAGGERGACRIELRGEEIRVPGAEPGAAETVASVDDLETWIGALARHLHPGGSGIHRDVVRIDVGPGDAVAASLVSFLAAAQVLPATFALVMDDVVTAAAFLAEIPLDLRERVLPVVCVRTGDRGVQLVTAGGGSLHEIGRLEDLRLADDDELARITLATGLLAVYAEGALATHRPAVLAAFRAECSGMFPLRVPGGWIERALRYRGTVGETASVRTAIVGHLLATGYYAEAHALLEATPRAARDRIHGVRRLRTLFGLGRFAEVVSLSRVTKLSAADEAVVREARAAQELLDRLDAVPGGPTEEIDPVEGRVLSVLHASAPQQSGGYAVRAHSVLKELSRRGLEVVPCTRPGFPEETNQLAPGEVEVEEFEGIAYRRLGTAAERKRGEYVYMLESVEHYMAAIRRERPEVVHLRSTHVSALPGLIAAKHFGIPTVYEVSGMWELVFEAANDSRQESRRARTVVLEDAVLRSVDSVCTITEAMGRIIESRVTPREPVRLVPNAVDPASFTERAKDDELLAGFGWDPSTPVIGYIGSFVDYEGLDVLVRALGELRARGVDHRALLVGDGAAAPRVRALAASLDLDPSALRFTGRVPHEEVARLYSLVDVCAYPRRRTPATVAVSPLKPFEAMASGKTVVVSDVPALVEIAGGGDRAMVVPAGDHVALADRLQAALQDPAAAAEMRDRAQRWVRQERSWDAVGGLLAQQLRDVAGARREVPPAPADIGSGA